jgi:hypothetical protein
MMNFEFCSVNVDIYETQTDKGKIFRQEPENPDSMQVSSSAGQSKTTEKAFDIVATLSYMIHREIKIRI